MEDCSPEIGPDMVAGLDLHDLPAIHLHNIG